MEEKEEEEMKEKIEKIVKNAITEGPQGYQFKYHIQVVRKYAKILARKYHADENIVDMIALLHDIGRFKFGPKRHADTGALEAERILKKFHYNKEFIEQVKNGIFSHRHSSRKKAESLEAKIVKDADALSHFHSIPMLFAAAFLNKKMTSEKGWKWIYDKIQRDWKSLYFPESRRIAKKKYNAIKTIFEGVFE
jgi:uncharacterized protein